MQQQLLTWIRQFNEEYAQVASLLLVLAIIFLVAIILHFILHKLVLPKISKAISQYDQKWQLSLEINKLFSRFAFLIQGVVVNIQALVWMGAGKTQEILTTSAQAWCLIFGLLMLFSIMDLCMQIMRNSSSFGRLPLKRYFSKLKTRRLCADWDNDYFPTYWQITSYFTQWFRRHDGCINVGV